MEFEEEKREALAMLRGIEQGEMTPAESFQHLDKADPILIYFIFKWIKKHYHRDHEQSEAVRARLADVTNTYRSLTRKAKAGESDMVVEWFEGTHRYSETSAVDFIDLVVDKLEG